MCHSTHIVTSRARAIDAEPGPATKASQPNLQPPLSLFSKSDFRNHHRAQLVGLLHPQLVGRSNTDSFFFAWK